MIDCPNTHTMILNNMADPQRGLRQSLPIMHLEAASHIIKTSNVSKKPVELRAHAKMHSTVKHKRFRLMVLATSDSIDDSIN